MGGAQNDDATALPQFLPERLLPLGAGVDAVIGVRVEEQGLVALTEERLTRLLGPFFVLCPSSCG